MSAIRYIKGLLNIYSGLYVGSGAKVATAVAQIDATDMGLLVPRMTEAQRDAIASPANSLLIFNTTQGRYNFYRLGAWNTIPLVSGVSGNVQYNNSGDLGADSTFTYDTVNKYLGVGTATPTATVSIVGEDDSLHTALSVENSIGYTAFKVNNDTTLDGKTIQTASVGNTRLGHATLQLNSGIFNTAIGENSLTSNLLGNTNTSLGYGVLQASLGDYNTGIGASALKFVSVGAYNTAVGHSAGYSVTSGNYNVFVGTSAGYNITSGDYNVCIGYKGPSVLAAESNRLYIGKYFDALPLIYGEFDNKLLKVYGRLDNQSNGNTSATYNTYNINSSSQKVFAVRDDGLIETKGFTIPSTDGTAYQVLSTDGSGTVSWQNSGSVYGAMGRGSSSYSVPIRKIGSAHAWSSTSQTGEFVGATFDAGGTEVAVSAFASGGTGVTRVTASGHGLVTGDYAVITGTTNYEGAYLVTYVSSTQFDIAKTYVSTETGYVTKPATITVAEAGNYKINFSLTLAPAAGTNQEVTLMIYYNASAIAEGRVIKTFPATARDCMSGVGQRALTAGSKVWLSLSSGALNNLTTTYGCFSVKRL